MGLIQVCTLISITVFIIFTIVSIVYRNKRRFLTIFLSPIHVFTLGVFIALFFIHVPVFFQWYQYGDDYAALRPFWLTIISSIRAFILDINYDDLKQTASSVDIWTHVFYLYFASFLYLLAPILTFTNILSLFNNVKGIIRLRVCFHKKICIFSEINNKSVIMAKSILKKFGKRAIIVFADSRNPDQTEAFSMLNCRELGNAILLKKNITAIHLKKFVCTLEFFLLSEDEEKNHKEFIKLNELNHMFPNRSVYMFSMQPLAKYIIDTVNLGSHTISSQLIEIISTYQDECINSPDYFKFDKETGFSKKEYFYSVRRIDVFYRLAVQTLFSDELLSQVFNATNNNKKITVTIIGIGNLGKTFLRIVLWMFQIYGYTLEINLIDSENEYSLQKKLKKEMPDIFQEKRRIASDGFPCYQLNHDGESNYLIRIIGGVEYQSSDLADLLSGNTQDVIINSQLFLIVNDDEKLNSELAISVRFTVEQLMIYTQRSRGDIKNSFVPKIYAYIHDDVLADSFVYEEDLYSIHQNHSRKNQIPIIIIGRESEVYHYASLSNWKCIEGDAMKYYFEWIVTSKRLCEIYEEGLRNYTHSPFLLKYLQEITTFKEKNKDFKFPSDFFYENGMLDSVFIQQMLTDYYQNEFYRDSAVSSFLYNQKILPYFKEYFQSFLIDETMHEGDLPEICMCERCLNLRKSEHMRWMAFMETCGYIYSPIQSHTVKLNSFLLPWNKLPAFNTYFTTCDLIRQ